MQTLTSEMLPKNLKRSNEMISSGIKLIDKIISHVDYEFIQELESQLVGKASQLHNVQEFCSNLVNQKVLDVAEIQVTPEVQERQEQIENVIKVACSKKSIGSLVIALERSGNERILKETCEWLEILHVRKKNYPIAIKSLARQLIEQEFKAGTYTFFDQTPLLDEPSNLGTFKLLQRSATKGITHVQFDKERMMACSADGTLNLWKWRGYEHAIKVVGNVKNITCFQYDDEVIVLGTSGGTVHLFDARTFEEKCSVELGEPVSMLKFVASKVLVLTLNTDHGQVWWVDIFRTDMQLQHQRSFDRWRGSRNKFPGICMDPDTSFVYLSQFVFVYDSKTGNRILDDNNESCKLIASDFISTLNVVDLKSSKKQVVVGFIDGYIGMWNASNLMCNPIEFKSFKKHDEAVVSLCSLHGHLLSLDQGGKLLMWSGSDLDEQNFTPAPRLLIENSNATSLYSHERWFACYSSKDDVINIWTVPDLWLRAD